MYLYFYEYKTGFLEYMSLKSVPHINFPLFHLSLTTFCTVIFFKLIYTLDIILRNECMFWHLQILHHVKKKPDIVWSVLYFNISILYLHQSSSLLFCFMFTPILSVWYIWNGNVCDKVPYVNLLKWSSDLVIIPT